STWDKETATPETSVSTRLEDTPHSEASQSHPDNDKQHPSDEPISSYSHHSNSLSLDMVITYLEEIKRDYHTSKHSQKTLEDIQNENNLLKQRNTELENAMKKKEEQLSHIQEEY